jgi:predicted signal transduction protein with EAL and GGDEF domain
VREAGCHLGQGFLWARPLTADEVTELLRRGGDLPPPTAGVAAPARPAPLAQSTPPA